jgi:hypothetical protein
MWMIQRCHLRCWLRDATPLELRAACKPFPRVAAKRDNPGLCLSNRFAVLLRGTRDLIRVSSTYWPSFPVRVACP